MNNKNIFVDFDGTLVDIAPRHYRVYEKCVKALGGTALGKEEYWEMKRANVSWDKLLPLSGLSIDEKDAYLKLFIDRIESQEELGADELFKDSLRTLEQLRANDNKLHLLSLRRNADALDWQIEHLGIRHLFERILSGHSDTKEGTLLKKADIVRQTVDNPSEVVIIGDTEADIAAAQQLGATSIALMSGIRNEEFLSAMHPNHLVDGIGDIYNIKL